MVDRGAVTGDFNNYRSPGIYRFNGGPSILNSPGSVAGNLEIIVTTGYVIQRITVYDRTYTRRYNGTVWTDWASYLTNADMQDYNCTQTAGMANYTLSILPIIFGRVVVIRLNNVVCKTPANSITLVSNNAPATNRGVSAVLCDSTGSGDTMRAIYGTEGQISLIGGTAGKTYFGEIVTISQLDI